MGGNGSNIPPSADAGDDQTVTDSNGGGEFVTLDGANSYDPDGDVVSYEWTEGGTVLGTAAVLPWTFAVGAHTVTLTVTDDEDATDTDTVVVTVNVYTVPVAADDSYSTKKGQMLTVSAPGLLANDTDADGDTLTAVWVSDPPNGLLTLNGDGSFTYMPNDGFTGKDSFTYDASDGGASSTGTVEINVKKNGKGPGGGDGGDGGGGWTCADKPNHPHCS